MRQCPPRATLPPPPRLVRDRARDEARTRPTLDPWSALVEEDIATLVPTDSEVRALFDDGEEGLEEQEETLLYVRAANDHLLPIDDDDDDDDDEQSEVIALDALVSVYARRTEELAKQQAHMRAIVAQAEQAPPIERTRSRWQRRRSRKEQLADLLRRHFYTIVFSLICIGGLLQLLLLP